MNIIVSIHDKWFQLIKSGEKTVEVRKNIPKKIIVNEYDFIYWYNTKTKKIEGKSRFFSTVKTDKEAIEKYMICFEGSCLSKEQLLEYMGNKERLFIWNLGKFESLELKLPEGKQPPQSWCYYKTVFPKGVTQGEIL